jgi:hypothetical protein
VEAVRGAPGAGRSRLRAARLLRGTVQPAVSCRLASEHDAAAVDADPRIPPRRRSTPRCPRRRDRPIRGIEAGQRPQRPDQRAHGLVQALAPQRRQPRPR